MDANKRGKTEVAPLIWTIGIPIIFIIGFVGNILTMLVLNRQSKKSSTTVYLTGLAAVDLLYLVVGTPRWWLIYNFNFDVRHSSAFGCKVHWLLMYAVGLMSSLFLVVLTVERILSTALPFKKQTLCSLKNSYIICTLVVVFAGALHSHILYGFDIEYISITFTNETQSEPGIIGGTVDQLSFNYTYDEYEESANITTKAPVCTWTRDKVYQSFYEKVYGPLAFATTVALPQFLFLVGGSYITWKLMKNNRFRKSPKQKAMSIDNRTTQITIMLLIVNFVFFLCVTPVYIFLLGRSSWIGKEMTSIQEIVWAVINLLNYLNHAVNFILYFLSGTRFRNAFFEFVNCCKQKRTSPELSTRAGKRNVSINEGGAMSSELFTLDGRSTVNLNEA